MPHRHEKKRATLSHEDDRRRKLTDAERAEIARNEGGLSQRALAARYGVSRRLITFLLDPSKQAENLRRRAERGGSAVYYDHEAHREAMRRHRHHKKTLDEAGRLIYEPCACDCGCEPDGHWHFDESRCACVALGCPCVVDRRRAGR